MSQIKNCCDHKHLFSCVQYNLPLPVAHKIIEWGKQNIPDDILYMPSDDATYGRETTIHCTVFFGLHTELATPIIYLLENEHSFLIRLGQISRFNNDKFDVVKIEAYSDDLFRLHEKLGNCLACTETYNAYRPHVTIAYVNRGEGRKFVGDKTFDRLTCCVETLCFSSKNGSRCRIRLKPNWHAPAFV
jgi:hypothetical protein